MENLIPKLQGKLGEKYFLFFDGRKSKTFYDASNLNTELGCYEILNADGKVVEYMDMLGQFTKAPTEFALCFCEYLMFEEYYPLVYQLPNSTTYTTALIDFPSKFLADAKVMKIVKEIENARINHLSQNGKLLSARDVNEYRKYVNNVFKLKMNHMKRYVNELSQI